MERSKGFTPPKLCWLAPLSFRTEEQRSVRFSLRRTRATTLLGQNADRRSLAPTHQSCLKKDTLLTLPVSIRAQISSPLLVALFALTLGYQEYRRANLAVRVKHSLGAKALGARLDRQAFQMLVS